MISTLQGGGGGEESKTDRDMCAPSCIILISSTLTMQTGIVDKVGVDNNIWGKHHVQVHKCCMEGGPSPDVEGDGHKGVKYHNIGEHLQPGQFSRRVLEAIGIGYVHCEILQRERSDTSLNRAQPKVVVAPTNREKNLS